MAAQERRNPGDARRCSTPTQRLTLGSRVLSCCGGCPKQWRTQLQQVEWQVWRTERLWNLSNKLGCNFSSGGRGRSRGTRVPVSTGTSGSPKIVRIRMQTGPKRKPVFRLHVRMLLLVTSFVWKGGAWTLRPLWGKLRAIWDTVLTCGHLTLQRFLRDTFVYGMVTRRIEHGVHTSCVLETKTWSSVGAFGS